MIRVTVYGVIAEKPRVRQLGQFFFRTSYRKNYALDQKWIPTFLMVSTSSITMQSLGKIAQCAPAVGAKIENMMSVFTSRLPWQPAGIKFTQCISGQKSAFSPIQE